MRDSDADLCFPDRAAWRTWLEENHAQPEAVWVVINKKATPPPGLHYEEAVLEALCFGWIDGTLNRIDDLVYALRFSPRRRDSVWSASNLARVEALIEQCLMMPAGAAAIEAAKASGQWEAALVREKVDVVPPDLESALVTALGTVDGYLALAPSRRKQLLHWLATAKRPATRARRVGSIVDEVRGPVDTDG